MEKCDLTITTSKESENEPETQLIVKKTKGTISSERNDSKKRIAKKGAGKKKARARSVSPSSGSSEDSKQKGASIKKARARSVSPSGSSKPTLYLTKDDLPKELKVALRVSKMIFLLIVVSLY
jgi:hypothetical protein